MRNVLQTSTPEQREALANTAGTTVAYLYMIAGGHRRASPKLCRRLIAADPRLTQVELRPDIYGAPPVHSAQVAA